MKLSTKGLLLVAVPGMIELALLAIVFTTQQRAGEAAQTLTDSKQILYQASALADPLLREVARVRTGIVLGDASLIERRAAWIDLSDRLTQLEHLVDDEPSQRARAARLRTALDAWHARCAQIAAGLRRGEPMTDFPPPRDERGEPRLPRLVTVFLTQLNALIDEEARLGAARGASLTRTRTRQQLALIAAIVGSMLTWAGAAAVFARNVGRRLATLEVNARRLGGGEPLPAPLAGNDEIAALDAVLHQTAGRLHQAGREQAALQARLRERAQELARVNDELRQETQDNEMFMYSVSHDLRSPLVNLQGFSKELQIAGDELRAAIEAVHLPAAEHTRLARLLDGDMRESQQFLRRAVTRAGAIIEALLRISRAGRFELQWQRVNVASVVERLMEGWQARARETGAVVSVGALPPAWGDPAAVEQIFGNLIGNAFRYLDPARPGRVEVGALDAEPPAAPVFAATRPAPRTRTYFVRDNGLGIPAAGMSKMFRAFQRLHGEIGEGEGVGLAVVRRIVERLGGRVWVESAEGAGSTFFVALPEHPVRGG